MKVRTRKRLRSGYFLDRKPRIRYRGQLLAAKMVDSSDQGLGVEMSAPLEIDSFVSFGGVGLRGRAQVVHCRPSDDGVFCAGLKVEAVSFRKLDVSSQALPDDLVEGVEEVLFGGTEDSSEEKSQANVSEPSMSQLAGVIATERWEHV